MAASRTLCVDEDTATGNADAEAVAEAECNQKMCLH